MFDARLRRLIDPPLNAVGRRIAATGLTADHVTLIGLVFGLASAGAVAAGWLWVALALLILNRVADGLDGAVARASIGTPFGGFLDIVSDFLVYAAIPLGFAVQAPEANALAAAFLLAGFLANGSAFFAFAATAEAQGLKTEAQGRKSLYYVAGLMEGGETIAFFIAFCIFPAWFPTLAVVFGALCLLSAAARILLARATFSGARGAEK
ncbi:MAG: CDP-alcohol phosphatidyltransferase family protein [Pseudomonadota bacterium]